MPMGRSLIGKPAPPFEGLDQDGQPVRLEDYRGRWLVLYFYPKDETPGCTRQACSFRDRWDEFREAGADVLGVSADSVESHRAFRENRRIPFRLLSDPERRAIRAYGADLLGLVTRRLTVIIDPQGVVKGVYESNLRAESHIPEALALLRAANR